MENAGFFGTPKGSSMCFIVLHAKCLYTEDMFRMCGGNWPNAPVSIINEYESCRNTTWTVDEALKKTRCANDALFTAYPLPPRKAGLNSPRAPRLPLPSL